MRALRLGLSGIPLLVAGVLSCGDGRAPDPVDGDESKSSRAENGGWFGEELETAQRALDTGDFRLTERLLRRRLEAQPRDARAALLLGMTLARSSNHGAARPWFERALELEPGLPPAHEHLGRTLFLLGELEGSRRELEAFLALAPNEPRAHYELAQVEAEEGRWEEARSLLVTAGRLHAERDGQPEAGEEPRARAARRAAWSACRARLGDVHFALGDLASARQELEAALELEPRNISSLYTLSLVRRRLGDEEAANEALAAFEAARDELLARDGAGE